MSKNVKENYFFKLKKDECVTIKLEVIYEVCSN